MSAPKKHSQFSASGAYRWLACPGSVALIAKAPPQVESDYAIEGTNAHECVEKLLAADNRDATAAFLRGKYGKEMVDHANEAVTNIEARRTKDAILLSETKVSLEFVAPDMFGTVDAAVVELYGRLTVIDFKYGAGIVVDPEDNPQLLYYALGLAHQYDYNFAEVAIVIIQPRGQSDAGPVREWVTDIATLKSWAKKFKLAVDRAKAPNAALAAGDHCRFCPAAAICPQISKKALGKAKGVFGPLEPSNPPSLLPSPADLALSLDTNLGEILSGCDELDTWIKAVREYAFSRAQKGKPVPGWKLVEKRSIRKWADIEAASKSARKTFGDVAFTEPELLSPAQMEKKVLASDRFIELHVTNVSSGVTLVPDSDKRQAVVTGPAFPPLELEQRKEDEMAKTKTKTAKKKAKK